MQSLLLKLQQPLEPYFSHKIKICNHWQSLFIQVINQYKIIALIIVYYFSDCLFDPELFHVYELIKTFYAEQLFFWGLPTQRLCVLKSSNFSEPHPKNFVFSSLMVKEPAIINTNDILNDFHDIARSANHQEASPSEATEAVFEATNEKSALVMTSSTSADLRDTSSKLRCTLCHLPVRGLAACCRLCGHLGHAKHVRNWFANGNLKCPVSYCDCTCFNYLAGYSDVVA